MQMLQGGERRRTALENWSGCGRVRRRRDRAFIRVSLTGLVVAALMALALPGLLTSARADDLGDHLDPVAALRGYVQSIAATPARLPELGAPAAAATDRVDPITALRNFLKGNEALQSPAVATEDAADRDFSGDNFAPLRGFAKSLSAGQAQRTGDKIKLADADNAYDALREFFEQKNAPPPAAQPAAASPKTKAAKPAAPPPPVAADYVGNKACLGCHASQAEVFGYTMMGRLLKQGKLQCESCHGPGSAHVKAGGGVGVGGIISFRKDDTSRTVEDNNAICLGCHKRGERTYWEGSVHEERGLACTDCHTIMKAISAKGQLKTAFEPDTCFQCHKDRRAQMFRSSHMPMREGKIVCSDCHNPHGSATEALIREDSINDNCYKCHAEKRGPFLWEHEPVRENCLNCHDPHGSINEYSLKVPRPRLCFECHSFGHGANSGFGTFSYGATMGQSCQNCHIMIHGSNSPAGAVFQR